MLHVYETRKQYAVPVSLFHIVAYLILCAYGICLFCSKLLMVNECSYMNLTSCILTEILWFYLF